MAPTVAELLDRLDASIGFARAAGWDPVGLQFGDPDTMVERVAVCHEVTADVVAAVESHPVDVLVSYHPLLFRPATRLVAGPSAEGRAYRLIRLGVTLAVVHTAFDVVHGGAADALAEALGLEDISGFGPNWGENAVKVVTFLPAAHADDVVAAMAGAGAGRIGAYSACSFRGPGTGSFYAPESASPAAGVAGALNHEAEVRVEMIAPATQRDQVVAAMVTTHPYEEPAYDVYETVGNAGFVGRHGTVDPQRLDELAARVAAQLACVPRVGGAADRRVRRVAVVPGSGGGFVSVAAGVADVLVTGDVGHHQAQRGLEQGLCVVDAGHVATERPGVERLYAALAEQVGARSLLHLDPSPWREG